MLQPYDLCPCGSGDKLKWCCKAFFPDIQKAEELFEQGQQEAALRRIDEIIAAHPDKVAPLGKKAQFQAQMGNLEAADETLEQAFAINKKYGPGLLMRAQLRLHEGELPGALLLARKAAEAFHPDAHDSLALVYHLIFDGEMSQQRVVAAHAALALALHYAPTVEQLRQFMEAYFGPESPLPEAARKVYTMRTPAAKDPARRAKWTSELPDVPPPHLGALARLCEEIATPDETDSAAWFNLGVARAWAGNAAGALEALEKSLAHETDDSCGRETAALGEVLRLGVGMESQSDYLQHAFGFNIPDAQAASALLKEWHGEGRLLVQPTEERSVIAALVLDLQKGIATSTADPAAASGTFAAYLHIEGTRLRMRGPNRASIERLRDTMREKLSLPPAEAEITTSTQPFHDLILPALIFPTSDKTTLTPERVKEVARKYFEDRWTQRALRSLSGNTPADAVGSNVLRRKVAGILDFLADCCTGAYLTQADFNRVRVKLGLEPVAVTEVEQPEVTTQPTPEPSAQPTPVERVATSPVEKPVEKPAEKPVEVVAAALNIPGMKADELGALDADKLTAPQLELAYQAAFNLKVEDATARFARTLIQRPLGKDEKKDRFKYYSYLILRALASGEYDAALALIESGETFDSTNNDAARRDDFDLRKGQVLAKKGDSDRAGEVFDALLTRSPDNPKMRIEIIETLLRMKKGKLALRVAEASLDWARDKNDRDSADAFTELSAAAKKTPG